MLDRFKSWPIRQQIGLPATLVAVALCAWATMERGLFDGLVLLTGLCGVFSLGMLLFPSRPRLSVEARGQAGNVLTVELVEPVRPLDKDAIVNEQAEEALATMPERPGSDIGEDDSLGEVANKVLAAGLQAALTGASHEALEEFESKVNGYKRQLRAWLGQVERARWERLRVFDGELRVRELGHAAADHVHLRLRFPEGFELDEDIFSAEAPPERPDFAPSAWQHQASVLRMLDKAATGSAVRGGIRLPGSEKALYSWESDAPVINYDLGRVNQSDHRDVASFSLRAAKPGKYQVEWEVSAAGLGRPAKGVLAIEVAEPVAGQPITSMKEAEAELEKYND